MSPMSVTDVVIAIASVGALGAAVHAGRIAARVFTSDRRREEQAQASMVNAWIGVRVTGSANLKGIIVQNGSDHPVYEVEILAAGFGTSMLPKLPCLPPGQFFLEFVPLASTADRGRRRPWDWLKPLDEIAEPIRPYTATGQCAVKSVSFHDAANRAWRRDQRGQVMPQQESRTSVDNGS
jgi:hypothetical protein